MAVRIDISDFGREGLTGVAALQGVVEALEIGQPHGVVGGQLGEGNDCFDGLSGISGIGLLLAGGASLDHDEPLLKAGIRGQGGNEVFLNVFGLPAVAESISIPAWRPGSGAASSSGHGIFSLY